MGTTETLQTEAIFLYFQYFKNISLRMLTNVYLSKVLSAGLSLVVEDFHSVVGVIIFP